MDGLAYVQTASETSASALRLPLLAAMPAVAGMQPPESLQLPQSVLKLLQFNALRRQRLF
jgi:hypothetical protein